MIRTLAAALATTTCIVALATPAAAQTRDYNVPAGSLRSALDSYARQSGRQVIYSGDVRTARSNGVRGTHTAEDALEAILAGTGFIARRDRSGALAIVRAGNGQIVGSPVSGEAEAGGAAADSESAEQEIVVTGSHIRGVQSSSPLIQITRTDMDRSGYTNVGDVIRSLPQNFAGGNNPQVQVGNGPPSTNSSSPTAGSAPNLRGLGPSSTLTLINGHRLPQNNPQGAVDISAIPFDAIERIEVVTDGASATYGSDAVGGVVNVILRERYEGALTTASVGAATRGGGLDRRLSQLIGLNWASGSILLSGEHRNIEGVDAGERSFTSNTFRPYSLLPSIRANSAMYSARQHIGPAVSLFSFGVYTDRRSNYFASNAANGTASFALPAKLEQFSVVGGIDVEVGRWDLTGSISIGNDDSSIETTQLGVAGAPDRVLAVTDTEAWTRSYELGADGPIVSLGALSVRGAVGVGHRADRYERGTTIGERNVDYLFGEVHASLVQEPRPFLHTLELNASGRYERYSDVGSTTVPKVGILYRPHADFALRASWGRSFRAPTLNDLLSLTDVSVRGGISNPPSAIPATILSIEGTSKDIRPERSETLNVGFEYTPAQVAGLRLSANYFSINYRGRIGRIPSIFTALSDPANAFFVTRNPSTALQQQIISDADRFFNRTAQPYDPSTIVAIVDSRQLNIAQQLISGLDLSVRFNRGDADRGFTLFGEATYLNIKQRLLESLPTQTISGTAFNPSDWRGRIGASWYRDGLSISATGNYTGSEINTLVPQRTRVDSWTTFDAQVAYIWPAVDVRVAISVQNVLDTAPPFLLFNTFRQGFNYDTLNASPMGRFVSFQISKRW